jgi:hypothetical protein
VEVLVVVVAAVLLGVGGQAGCGGSGWPLPLHMCVTPLTLTIDTRGTDGKQQQQQQQHKTPRQHNTTTQLSSALGSVLSSASMALIG